MIMITNIMLGIIGIAAGLLAVWFSIIAIVGIITERKSNKNMSHGCMERNGKNGCC